MNNLKLNMRVRMPPPSTDGCEEPITPFDAAAYIYELVGEFGRMARDARFMDLARTLDLAREQAAQAMVHAGRAAQSKSGKSEKPASDDDADTA
jgi:hypothetical protein